MKSDNLQYNFSVQVYKFRLDIEESLLSKKLVSVLLYKKITNNIISTTSYITVNRTLSNSLIRIFNKS